MKRLGLEKKVNTLQKYSKTNFHNKVFNKTNYNIKVKWHKI